MHKFKGYSVVNFDNGVLPCGHHSNQQMKPFSHLGKFPSTSFHFFSFLPMEIPQLPNFTLLPQAGKLGGSKWI